ncbi:hypothetical protein IW262DRAFT_1296934 [Armillaria fumosa]|nr:hypothetical protein IW262DRAFT_1296934 [Armillaria fumosa]
MADVDGTATTRHGIGISSHARHGCTCRLKRHSDAIETRNILRQDFTCPRPHCVQETWKRRTRRIISKVLCSPLSRLIVKSTIPKRVLSVNVRIHQKSAFMHRDAGGYANGHTILNTGFCEIKNGASKTAQDEKTIPRPRRVWMILSDLDTEWKIILTVVVGSFLAMSIEYEAAQHRNHNSLLCHLCDAYPRLTKIKTTDDAAPASRRSWCNSRYQISRRAPWFLFIARRKSEEANHSRSRSGAGRPGRLLDITTRTLTASLIPVAFHSLPSPLYLIAKLFGDSAVLARAKPRRSYKKFTGPCPYVFYQVLSLAPSVMTHVVLSDVCRGAGQKAGHRHPQSPSTGKKPID